MDAPATSTAPDPTLLAAIKETIKAELAPVQEQLDEQKASLARASEWSATIEQKVATATATAMALHGTSARGAAIARRPVGRSNIVWPDAQQTKKKQQKALVCIIVSFTFFGLLLFENIVGEWTTLRYPC